MLKDVNDGLKPYCTRFNSGFSASIVSPTKANQANGGKYWRKIEAAQVESAGTTAEKQ